MIETDLPAKSLPKHSRKRTPGRIPAPLTAVPAVVRAQWRQVRGLLLAIGATVLLAAALAGAIAPFSTVMLTAALRSALTKTPDSDRLVVSTTPGSISSEINQAVTLDTDSAMGYYLGKSLSSQREALVELPDLALQTPLPPSDFLQGKANLLSLLSASAPTARATTNIIQGRLPADSASSIEIALTADAAKTLGVTVGSTLTANVTYLGGSLDNPARPPQVTTATLQLPVVGIFALATTDDAYMNATTFAPQPLEHGYAFTALASPSALLGAIDRLAVANSPTTFGASSTLQVTPQAQIFQIYHLDVAHISIDQVDGLINEMQQLLVHYANMPQSTDVFGVSIAGGPIGSDSSLAVFRSQAQFPQLVVGLFLLQIVALMLLFISTLAQILVERQEATVALLRSRGAPRWNLFVALALEAVVVAVVAGVVGTLLAIPLAIWLAGAVLPPATAGALNVITADVAGQLQAAAPYGLGIAGVAILTVLLITGRAVQLNALAARREAGRSTRRPAWQRLNLDLVAALLALVAFGVSTYLGGTVQNSTQSRALLAPLALAGPILLAIAVALLAVRLFPWALRGASWLADRGRGATPQLALAQLTRAPGQNLRAALLLAFALALVIVTGVFAESQAQRPADAASYLAVSDFSGALPPQRGVQPTFSALTKQYQQIPGVTSASLGYVFDGYQEALNANVELEAVDTSAYARTVSWTWPGAPKSLAPLLGKLIPPKRSLLPLAGVPALLDANLWNALHLRAGDLFSLDIAQASAGFGSDDSSFPFLAVAEVQHLPPLADDTSGGLISDVISGGLLVDYQTYAAFYKHIESNQVISPNHVWLRTVSDPATLARTRAILTRGSLSLNPLYDRRAIAAYMQGDTINLDLTVVPLLGALLTLALAIIGIALSAWQSASQRVSEFGLLRALGVSRGQVARILWWEQLAIYPVALALGLAMGLGLSGPITRSLVYSDATSAPIGNGALEISSVAEFYARQQVPPARVVYPPEIAILVACLAALGLVAATIMAWRVSRRISGATLRFDDD